MNLIYIANSRIPTEKAHGLQIVKMCEAFSNYSEEVQLIIPKRKNDINEDIFSYYQTKDNFKIKKINSFDFYQYWEYLGKLSFWLQSFSFAIRLLFMKADKKSIIYTRDPEIGWLFSLRGYKTVYEAHTWPENRRWLYKFLIRKIKKIITISYGLKGAFISAGCPENNILVAPDGVDLEEFGIKISAAEARRKLKLPLDKKIIMYTGHLYEWKGAQILADAADLLENDSVTVFVGGTEHDLKKFKKINSGRKNILIIGYVKHEKIPYYLKAADILVLPNSAKEKIFSRYTSPLKLFEYMSANRPIVASDLPSIREVLNENNCVLVEPDNPASLANGIKKILENKIFAEAIAKQALIDIKNFSWSRRAESIINFMN